MEIQKTRLLVVDDQPRLARIIRLILEETEKYEVQVELHPEQVSSVVRSFRPAAIILDVDMPEKNGAEVARDLWREKDLCDIPILFFTGLVGLHEAGIRDTAHGKMHFVSKLAQPEELVLAIEKLLEPNGETRDVIN